MYARHQRRALLVGLATAALLAAGTGAAEAGGTPGPTAPPTGDGAQALCKRAPRIDQRIDRALQRLNAGADRRGSIARLQKRLDNAKAAGHAEVATYLQDRLTFRKSLVPMLEQRKQDLADVQTWCRSNHGGAS